MPTKYSLTINGQPVSVNADADARLLWVLREQLDLTGTKYGCGEGQCGACTVLVDGRAQRSCLTPLASVSGKSVVTIEGLAKATACTRYNRLFSTKTRCNARIAPRE